MKKLIVSALGAALLLGAPLAASAASMSATGERGSAGEQVRIVRLDDNAASTQTNVWSNVELQQQDAVSDPAVVAALESHGLGVVNVVDIGRDGGVTTVYVSG